MISFRVSEDEFQQLKSQSESRGAGSVSDYARLSLCGEISGPPDPLASRILELDGDLRHLRVHVERLTAVVESNHSNVAQAGTIQQQGGGTIHVHENISDLSYGNGGVGPAHRDGRIPADDLEN